MRELKTGTLEAEEQAACDDRPMWISTLEAMDRELVGARLTEILETIAVRPAVRAVILTGAGHRAFSVGSDLRQRKNMTKEDWLRQRQDFDRTL